MTVASVPATADARAHLELEAISVTYPGRRTPSLDDVSLEAGPGERLGVAGRTGAGKSTVALVAAGFVPRVVRAAVRGRLLVGGELQPTSGDARSLAGRVGIIFSTPANQLSASKLSVREELAFGLENLALPRAEMDARIDDALERLDVVHLADREPFSLSGGEQQRVAIASMVAMGNDILVLDEPTAQLDPAGALAVARLLADLAARGAAIVCAEQQTAILGGLDRCLLLDAGRAVVTAAPGAALASASLTAIGLTAPAIVRLAEALGVDPHDAFDEGAILLALGQRTSASAASAGHHAPAATLHPTIEPGWQPLADRTVPLIEVEALAHRYGAIEAVRDVSLTIAPGERVAIVGRNGSGKTTLAKHLVGLLRPAAGVIRIDGRDIAGDAIHEVARTVGFVFQDPDAQLFARSIEREVAFGPRNLGLDPARTAALVGDALAAVGLEGDRATNPYDLDVSGRKLVALASILAMDPSVLVLDEPTTGQDWPGVARVGAIVDAMAGAGRTVVAITHDMEFAAAHFERIVVMRAGSVIADGSPATVFAPANHALLESTGLLPPVTARLAARLGWSTAPLSVEALLAGV
jgi:energy-coupling factor transport system ATP-binding protein